jgi:hypothetical protein
MRTIRQRMCSWMGRRKCVSASRQRFLDPVLQAMLVMPPLSCGSNPRLQQAALTATSDVEWWRPPFSISYQITVTYLPISLIYLLKQVWWASAPNSEDFQKQATINERLSTYQRSAQQSEHVNGQPKINWIFILMFLDVLMKTQDITISCEISDSQGDKYEDDSFLGCSAV